MRDDSADRPHPGPCGAVAHQPVAHTDTGQPQPAHTPQSHPLRAGRTEGHLMTALVVAALMAAAFTAGYRLAHHRYTRLLDEALAARPPEKRRMTATAPTHNPPTRQEGNAMTTRELREAAHLIRQRAQNATPGEWYPDGNEGVYAYGDDTTDHCPTVVNLGGCPRPDDINHIAGWGPLAALAVADLLDHIADTYEQAGVDGDIDQPYALAVARAYLAPTTENGLRVPPATGSNRHVQRGTARDAA